MTDENIGRNVADEMRLAESALAAADKLLGAGLCPDAASRTYYAAFHAARALLFSAGVEPRSHRAVHSLLSQHFVRTGLLPAEHAKHLVQLEAVRSAGDYDTAFALGPDDIRPEIEKARRFLEAARHVLTDRGCLDQ